jgi:hypothetical protein
MRETEKGRATRAACGYRGAGRCALGSAARCEGVDRSGGQPLPVGSRCAWHLAAPEPRVMRAVSGNATRAESQIRGISSAYRRTTRSAGRSPGSCRRSPLSDGRQDQLGSLDIPALASVPAESGRDHSASRYERRVGRDVPTGCCTPVLVALPASTGRWSRSGGFWPVGRDPSLDVIGEPDLALREVGQRRRKVRAAGDLVNALPADPSQPHPDLVSTNDTERLHHHI